MSRNTLYYGDNLNILRRYIEDESVDLIYLDPPFKSNQIMIKEASTAGFYHSKGWEKKYPRIQILTIEDLFYGREIDYPPHRQVNVTFKKARRQRHEDGSEQLELDPTT